VTEPTVPVIGLDMDEAIELIEILEDLSAWIHDAPAEVKTSWQRHTGGTYSAARLRTDLLRWSQRLATRSPLSRPPA
jgi:hypothetical protein